MTPLPTGTEGHGLVLRNWTPEDAPALHAAVVASMEHLRPYMPWIGQEPLPVEARAEMLARWEQERLDGGDSVFGVWRHGVVVGSAGLHRRLGPHGLEIGYWVHVDHLGRGVATAASSALTELAFTIDEIDRVEIHHDVTNEDSRRVPEKLGFERVADIRPGRTEVAPAETGTDAVWRTTRAAWAARSAG